MALTKADARKALRLVYDIEDLLEDNLEDIHDQLALADACDELEALIKRLVVSTSRPQSAPVKPAAKIEDEEDEKEDIPEDEEDEEDDDAGITRKLFDRIFSFTGDEVDGCGGSSSYSSGGCGGGYSSRGC